MRSSSISDILHAFGSLTGTPEHIFEWGEAGGMSWKSIWKCATMAVVGRQQEVRGGVPGKVCNALPIIQWETSCLKVDMHPVLVENG